MDIWICYLLVPSFWVWLNKCRLSIVRSVEPAVAAGEIRADVMFQKIEILLYCA